MRPSRFLMVMFVLLALPFVLGGRGVGQTAADSYGPTPRVSSREQNVGSSSRIATFVVGTGSVTAVTVPLGISLQGVVVGQFNDTTGHHGFLRAIDGSVTQLDVPGVTNQTYPTGINNAGVVVGWYFLDTFGTYFGFTRPTDGISYTTFTVPGSSAGTFATAINNNGVVAGGFLDSSGLHGFLRDAAGNVTTFDPPGSVGTTVTGINDLNEVVGYYILAPGAPAHGFLRNGAGKFTVFNAAPGKNTLPTAINNSGVVAGHFDDNNRVNIHSFVRDALGKITIFDAPRAGEQFNEGTQATCINNSGQIAGYYTTTGGVGLSFSRDPSGNILVFEAPPSTGGPPATYASAINAKGQITGSYNTYLSDNEEAGFIRY